MRKYDFLTRQCCNMMLFTLVLNVLTYGNFTVSGYKKGGMNMFEYSARKWPKTHTQKLFLSNGKIVYYQNVPQ